MMNGGIVIREREESHLRPEETPSFEPRATDASVRSRPGILIFSPKRQLLHINSQASEMTGVLDRVETESVGMPLARAVNEIRIQVQDVLDSRRDANVGNLFELKRVISEAGRKILVRGFGVASQSSHGDSRVIVVLEEQR